MAKRKKDDLDDLTGGLYVFQEVSKVKIKPGLGVFVDPNPDLSPDEEGKVPISLRASEGVEMMRFKATKAKIDQFIQENRQDLVDEKVSPDSFDLTTLIAAGFFTEKILREFMGEGAEEEETGFRWSARAEAEVEDWDDREWVTGKGWVKKEKKGEWWKSKKYTDGWDDGMGYGGGYYSGYSGYSSYTKPQKRYRTLLSQLKPLTDAVKTEMFENALKVLEDPMDLSRVLVLKILEKVDILKLEELPDYQKDQIVRDVMTDIRWAVGWGDRYRGLLRIVEVSVAQMVDLLSKGVVKLFTEAESPERLMVDFAVLLDVEMEEPRSALSGLFGKIAEEMEGEEAERAAVEQGSDSDEREFDMKQVDLAPDEIDNIPKYTADAGVWGRLRIIEHPLAPQNDLRRKTVTYRATDCGTHLGDISRLLTDQRVFREMRSTPSGSLLVDCSGSMGLSVGDVNQVLNHVPGAVIGLYSGNGGSGVLHIVARSGKVAANLDAIITAALRMGGNVVDGPSLEWLITMPQPRIWYSDGGVTGLRDSASYGLRPQANELMRRGKVGRIQNQKILPHAFKAMRKQRTVGKARMA